MNPFHLRLATTGNATQKQHRYFAAYIQHNGLKKFREYREQTGIYTPLYRMSKSEAFKLIQAIEADRAEAGNE